MNKIYLNNNILSGIDSTPLTMENLTKPEHHISSKKRKQKSPATSSASSTHSSRSSSRRCRSRDTTVLQSPRMLSFPYHNDSLFLPTVEQHRPSEKARSMASSIRSGSFSIANSHRHYRQNSTITTRSSSIYSTSSSSIPPSPATSASLSSSSSKRRKVIPGHRHHHRAYAAPPPPLPPLSSKYRSSHDTSCPSPSWIQKAWKVFRKSSWRRQLPFSIKTAF